MNAETASSKIRQLMPTHEQIESTATTAHAGGGTHGAYCLQIFQLQLQLLDLTRDTLALGAEHHAEQLGDDQLEMIDLAVAGEQLRQKLAVLLDKKSHEREKRSQKSPSNPGECSATESVTCYYKGHIDQHQQNRWPHPQFDLRQPDGGYDDEYERHSREHQPPPTITVQLRSQQNCQQ